MDGASKCSPAAAVPVRTNIPEPMMAPIPSAVSDHGPSDLRRRCSGSWASAISLSIDLQQRSWLPRACAAWSVVGKGPKGPQYWSRADTTVRPPPKLSLRLSAHHLLYFPFLRSASILAGLQRMFQLALLAGSALRLLAFLFAKSSCIGHDCFSMPDFRPRQFFTVTCVAG